MRMRQVMGTAALLIALASMSGAAAEEGPYSAIADVQPKMVKIYGAGGFRLLEAYQSGMLISDDGYILTVFSYVLDTDRLSVTLDDGRRFAAEQVGADPRSDVAVLKIDAMELPHFDLDMTPAAEAGEAVLAVSNLFGLAFGNESCSVQHGVIAAETSLDARRGAYETPYDGPIYVIDAMTNNPGAAGGALIDRRGRLLGMLGKELEHAHDRTWLNYAVPIAAIRDTVDAIRQGRLMLDLPEDRRKPQSAWSVERAGLVLVPDVLRRTPPYVDQLRSDSPAAAKGIRPDDLVIMVGDQLIQSQEELVEALQYIDRLDPIRLTLMRGGDLIEVELVYRDGNR